MDTLAKQLFVRSHEMEPAARTAFLADACGDDAELRLAVERMLVEAERADSFFAATDGTTIGAPEFGEGHTERESDTIGPYKLLQQIGEGGFGTVWMAEQSKPITRTVALKVIKAGMDTKQVLARFEAERQALAIMDHPNIAKVLDAGATAAGRPYFAMELVKGIPITRYCDEANLGTRERLALFADVCSAINHAHQKGIIHRDIKPSNVLVTLYADKPVVKVIDFGIAKATQSKLTDKTLFTRFEQMVGTPVYMSPEQAALSAVDIDTRSDIYSLGVLLYELLVGTPPFDSKSLLSAGYEEMCRIIREVEPARPSSRLATFEGEQRTLLAKARRIEPEKLRRLVEPDLDWIVMKAIEKDRTRRYESANGLAEDLRRHLANEPVTARPPSTTYRLQKAWRRNRLAYTTGMAVVGALMIGLVASIIALVGQDRLNKVELDAAKAKLDAAESQNAAELSGARADSTVAVVTGMLDKVVQKLLDQDNRTAVTEMMRSADALVSDRLKNSPIAEFKVREAMRDLFDSDAMWQLDEASRQSARMEELLPMLSEEELPALERLRFQISAAGTRASYKEFVDGTSKLQAIRRDLERAVPKPTDLIIETLIMEGDANLLNGDLAEAERLVREAFALDPEIVGDLSLTGESPVARLANVLLLQGKYAEAAPHARRAFELVPENSRPQRRILFAGRAVTALCGAEHFEVAERFIGEQEIKTKDWDENDRRRWQILRALVLLAENRWEEATSRLIEVGLQESAGSMELRLGALAAMAIGDSNSYAEFVQKGSRFIATADDLSAYRLFEILTGQPQPPGIEAVARAARDQLEAGNDGWWKPIALMGDARLQIYGGHPEEALKTMDRFVHPQAPLYGVTALIHRQIVEAERHQFIRAVALAQLGREVEARAAFEKGWNQEKSGPPIATHPYSVVTNYLSRRSSRQWAAGFLTAEGIQLPEAAIKP